MRAIGRIPGEGRFRAFFGAALAALLFAAPLQADHESFNVAVTLAAEPGDGQVVLRASHTSGGNVVGLAQTELIGYRYREKSDGAWGSWQGMGSDGNVEVQDLTNGTAYTYEAQAIRATMVDGDWHLAYSDSSDEVTVTPTAAAQ